MIRTKLFFVVFFCLTIFCLYSQPQMPILLAPPDQVQDLPELGVELIWMQPDLLPGMHFFEIRLDSVLELPAPPIYMGPAMEFYNGEFFAFPTGPLLPGTTYFWNIRVIDMITMMSAESPVWRFSTLGGIQPPMPPVPVYPEMGATGMQVQGLSLEWNQSGWVAESFFDVFCDIDSSFPGPPVWSGPLPPMRELFIYELGPLIQDQIYYWRIRYTDQLTGIIMESPVMHFYTGNFAIPYSTISGTISSVHNVSGVTMVCPQACVPTTITTGVTGAYSFIVNNGLNPVVTPAKSGFRFSPSLAQYTNIQADQTANFTMSSLLPNSASLPLPANLAENVSINIGMLQWSYFQDPGYSPPLGFEVYFPADSPIPYGVVLYEGRDPEYSIDIDPLEYSSPYSWSVKPYNADGWAEYMESWSFGTEAFPGPEYPPAPLYVYPPDLHPNAPDYGLYMVWRLPEDREEYPVESFFDVFLDIDPSLTGPPVYSGSGIVYPHNPSHKHIYAPQLLPGTTYYWKVRVTDLNSGLSTVSDTWQFTTSQVPIPHPWPSLTMPPDGMVVEPLAGVDLGWTMDYWHIDSFFDVFCDPDPSFPNPQVVTMNALPEPFHQFHFEDLAPGTTYNWYIRYSNPMEYWFSRSTVGQFSTQEEPPPPPGPPVLLYPPNGANDIPTEGVTLQFDQPGWQVESFFDIYCDIDPDFPNPPVYSGPIDRAGRTVLEYHLSALMAEQPYYWFVRYSNSVDSWTSAVFTFLTTPIIVPSSTISGDIRNYGSVTHSLSGVRVSCPGACVPATVTTGMNGLWSFTVNNGFNYTVTPSKMGYFFTPINRSYSNVQANQTGYFYISTLRANISSLVWPPLNAQNISVGVVNLQWDYIQQDGYALPTHFDVYFPADSGTPVTVLYGQRDYSLSVNAPNPDTEYTWKVVPVNETWPAEDVPVWNFTTAPLPPGPPVLLYPPNGANDIPTEGVTLQFDQPGWQVESFFDIYCDIDSDFPNPPVYSGPIDRAGRTVLEYHLSALMAEQPYYWFVRYSNSVDSWTSAVFTFLTTPIIVPSSTISGDIRNYGSVTHSLSGVRVSCPGACVPASVTTGMNGLWSFTVNNGFNYTVTPSKMGYFFTPINRSYSNVQANQTGYFYISTLRANISSLVWPPLNAQNISVGVVNLQWDYIQQDGYALPTHFDVYFPADSGTPVTVLYGQRDHSLSVMAPNPDTEYTWKVVPVNDTWPAEDVPVWTFTTESLTLGTPVVTIGPDGTLSWGPVTGAVMYRIYKSLRPDGDFMPIAETPEPMWLDPAYPQSRAFYRVSALAE